jgi:hypothetical protein
MDALRALNMARRSRALFSGLGSPNFAAIVISRASLVKFADRAASFIALACFVVAHFE